MKAGNWKTISSERHFADPNLQVVTDRVQTPARAEPRAWTIVHRKAAVVDRTNNSRRQNRSHPPGTNPDPRSNLGNTIRPDRPHRQRQAGNNRTSRIAGTSRRSRLRAGKRRRTDFTRPLFLFARFHGRARLFLFGASGSTVRRGPAARRRRIDSRLPSV